MRYGQLIWESVDATRAQAAMLVDFGVDTSWRFDLSPQVASFTSNPLYANEMEIVITGLYRKLTVTLDSTPYVFRNQYNIKVPTGQFSHVQFDAELAGGTPLTAVAYFYNYPKSEGQFTQQQNPLNIADLNAVILDAGYIRNSISAAVNTIVAPASNLYGVRVDGVFLQCETGFSIRAMARSSAPGAVFATGLTLGMIRNVGAIGNGWMTYPLIVPAGLGIYEMSNDGVNSSVCTVDYKIL